MSTIYTSAEQLIGHTPLLDVGAYFENDYKLNAKIYAKLELFNPAGSIKDRAAREMLDDAEADGRLKPGATIIEPTSGNTGIGLCMIAALRGYKAIIVMPDTMSVERIKLMKAYGAEVVLTPGKLGMAGAIAHAEELSAEIPGSFIPAQFDNPSNAKAHFDTTGPEIFEDTDGKIDILVASVGTGGTITGLGHYLKSVKPEIEVVAVEPATSAVLSGKPAGAHKIQGIGAGFIPKVLDTNAYDKVVAVSNEDAYEFARMLGKRTGVLVGISSGAAFAGAVEVAKLPENKGKNIVAIFPDGGSRYLSGDLYQD